MRRGTLTGTLSILCCWNHLRSASLMSLHSGFQNHFLLEPFHSNALVILVLFLQIFWIIEFIRPNSQHTLNFFFPFFISHITLNFPSVFKTFLFVTVTMLSVYQSSVNCWSRKVDGNFTLPFFEFFSACVCCRCLLQWLTQYSDIHQQKKLNLPALVW